MIEILAEQAYALAMVALLMLLPGWAVGRLVELQLAVPKVLLPPAWFVFGLAQWTIVVAPVLAFGAGIRAGFVAHAIITIFLILAARARARTHGQAKPLGGDVARWTVVGIVSAGLLAAAFRTRMAFDTLFHLGIVRRIATIDDIGFGDIDRIVGAGINPSYAVPSWQAALAMVATVTGLDPATILESVATLIVLLAACAAAGLGRAVSGRLAGEIAGVAAYAWLRVYFPRRELEGDGIAYAALPGNVALDVLLPVLLVALLAVATTGPAAPVRRRGAIVLGAASSALLVVLHANYVLYVAIFGLGMLGWGWASGALTVERRTQLLRAAMVVAVPAAAALVAMMPVLTQLEDFGRSPVARIDYYLTGSVPWRIIRPGHVYDWFAAPGLLAVLLYPFAVARARGVARWLLGGAMLGILAFAFVPWLLELMDSTGSRTIGMRMPRAIGVLLAAGLAVAIPGLIDDVRTVARRVRGAHGAAAAWLVRLAPFAAVIAASALYGYPLARREPPQYGWNWPTILMIIALCALLGDAVRRRGSERGGDDRSAFAEDDGAPAPATRGRRMSATTGIVVLVIGLCLLPSGFTSLRRGAWQSRQVAVSWRSDDLGCMAGVERELRGLAPGGVLLADPVTAYAAQALAPERILADYKVWNGKTDTSRAHERIELLRQVFGSDDPSEVRAALDRIERRYHARYLLVASGPVEPPLESTIGTFDAVALRGLLDNGSLGADLIASGQGTARPGATAQERAECDLSLYRIRPAPRTVTAEVME